MAKALGENTPNYFLINIQSYQTEGIREILKSSDGVNPEFVPLVRARMTKINGQSVQDRSYPDERGNWLANREANLSWSKTVNSKIRLQMEVGGAPTIKALRWFPLKGVQQRIWAWQ